MLQRAVGRRQSLAALAKRTGRSWFREKKRAVRGSLMDCDRVKLDSSIMLRNTMI
jgi:hypothetical protein